MNFAKVLMIMLISQAANADRTVQTTCGPVRSTTVGSGKVEAFLGIPYAEPPVGRLRFAKPVPKAPWEDVYYANQLPPACIQTNRLEFIMSDITRMSEDCLYLNVWVPQLRDTSERKAIILYIHGGALMVGSGNEGFYDGAALAEYGDVVVVTINYRLGGLGFFTGFINEAPGNIGLHDQAAAIRWVKENAEIFQGDPNNIVLMGQSMGSISITAHLISPLSKNLFGRAILFSGTIFHPIFSVNNTLLSNLCQEYADILGCTANGETLKNDPEIIVECMKNLPVQKFIQADGEIVTNLEDTPRDPYSQVFLPRIGDDFLPDTTIDSFRNGNFKHTEILIGITRDEGSVVLSAFMRNLFGEMTPFLNRTLSMQIIRSFVNSSDESYDDKIVQAYMDRVNEEEENSYLKAVIEAAGDYSLNCGAMFQADILSLRNNPIYFYKFDYLPLSSEYPEWMGVPHGEELYYVFGNFFLREYTEMDRKLSRNLMDRLVAFAKTGNPNVPKRVTWPRYSFKDPKYLVIGEKDRVETKPNLNRCEVWRKRFGAIIDDDLIRRLKNIESHPTVRFFNPLYNY